jgi:hypothetical protein
VKSCILAITLIGYGSAAAALPPPVELAFSAGYVSVSAVDAPVADVLAAWNRTGHTELSGVEYLGARRISIRLTRATESDALRSIIGSPGWYATVSRDGSAASESTFQRISILPAAASAANESAPPESRYTYTHTSDPDADSLAAAQLAMPPARDVPRRPADVDPEAFYHYDPISASDGVEPVVSRQPYRLTLGVEPEVLNTYTPTPEPIEPVVSSSLMPQPRAAEPEVLFSYTPTPELPASSAAVPDLPVVDGFSGMRLPGRVIRYVLGG